MCTKPLRNAAVNWISHGFSLMEHSYLSRNLVITRKTDVPEYLKHGEFFKSLNNDDDNGQISVPRNTLKPNTLVESNEDLEYLLSSLRFWALDAALQEVVIYCLFNNPTNSCITVLEAFKIDFRYVDILIQMIPLVEQKRWILAINSGILELVAILHESCCAQPDDGCHLAARAGHLPILKFLYEHGAKVDSKVKVAFAGEEDCPTFACACSNAAAGGNLACLEYLHKCCGCPWAYGAIFPALWEGQIECVEYAIQHGCPVSDDRYTSVSAQVGHLDILKLLHSAGAAWYEQTCQVAAEHGHLHCLQYLHEHGCPWDANTCTSAAMNGQLECLKYAHEHGCPWDRTTSFLAARQGHLHCMEYLHEKDCPWDEYTCAETARGGHIDCLRYAHEHGCSWDESTCYHAAQGGHLECLKYAHENGCSWDGQVCRSAAGGGHLACLQYAHENGCPWNSDTCNYAILDGHLECLKYAHEHGCPVPVGEDLYELAVQRKNLECAEYIENCIV